MKKVLLAIYISFFMIAITGCTKENSKDALIGKYWGRETNSVQGSNQINKQIIQNKNTLIELQSSKAYITDDFSKGLYTYLKNKCEGTSKLNFSQKKSCLERELIIVAELLKVQDKDYKIYNYNDYTGDNQILKAYYKGQNRSHPIFLYYVDLIKTLQKDYNDIKNIKFPNFGNININKFYVANMNGNTLKNGNLGEGFSVRDTKYGLVIYKSGKEKIENKFGYKFYYGPYPYLGISPADGIVITMEEDFNGNIFLYQITSGGGGSGDYNVTVYVYKNGLWIPFGLIVCAGGCHIEKIAQTSLIDSLFFQPSNMATGEVSTEYMIEFITKNLHFYDQIRLLTK